MAQTELSSERCALSTCTHPEYCAGAEWSAEKEGDVGEYCGGRAGGLGKARTEVEGSWRILVKFRCSAVVHRLKQFSCRQTLLRLSKGGGRGKNYVNTGEWMNIPCGNNRLRLEVWSWVKPPVRYAVVFMELVAPYVANSHSVYQKFRGLCDTGIFLILFATECPWSLH